MSKRLLRLFGRSLRVPYSPSAKPGPKIDSLHALKSVPMSQMRVRMGKVVVVEQARTVTLPQNRPVQCNITLLDEWTAP